MNRDYILILIECIVTIGLLIRFVPKNKIRHANVIFLFKFLLSWILSILVSEFRLIDYPIRPFPYAHKTSFTFESLVYPALCVIFNIHFPKEKSYFKRFMYYFYYCSAITILEVLTERYTDIIKYVHWTWYVTWITLFITFHISRAYYLWFFKLNKDH